MFGSRYLGVIVAFLALIYGCYSKSVEITNGMRAGAASTTAGSTSTLTLDLYSYYDFVGTHSTMTLKPNQCYEVPGSLSAKFNGGVPGKGYMMLCTDMLCRGLCALRTRADWYYPNNLIYDAGAPVYSAKWFA